MIAKLTSLDEKKKADKRFLPIKSYPGLKRKQRYINLCIPEIELQKSLCPFYRKTEFLTINPFLLWMMKIFGVLIATLSSEERGQRKRVGKDTDLNTRCVTVDPFALCISIIPQKAHLSTLFWKKESSINGTERRNKKKIEIRPLGALLESVSKETHSGCKFYLAYLRFLFVLICGRSCNFAW